MLNQDYTAKLLNLEDIIITNVENICEELHISIELPRKSIFALPAALPQTMCTTIGCRRSRMFLWQEIPSCIFESAATAALAESASSRRTHFCLAIIVSPAGWWPKSSMPLKGRARQRDRLSLQRIRHDCHALFQMRKPQTHRTAGGTLSGRVQGKLRRPEVQQHRCRFSKPQSNRYSPKPL